MHKYSINLIWSDDDECYVATIPEFPGLSAFGDTTEEAVQEATIALKGFLKVYKEDGCELPQPEKLKQYSGQIRLRMPKSLHNELSQKAKSEGVSLNQYIVHLLSERHVERPVTKKLDKIESLIIGSVASVFEKVQAETKQDSTFVKDIELYDLDSGVYH